MQLYKYFVPSLYYFGSVCKSQVCQKEHLASLAGDGNGIKFKDFKRCKDAIKIQDLHFLHYL